MELSTLSHSQIMDAIVVGLAIALGIGGFAVMFNGVLGRVRDQ